MGRICILCIPVPPLIHAEAKKQKSRKYSYGDYYRREYYSHQHGKRFLFFYHTFMLHILDILNMQFTIQKYVIRECSADK